MARTHPHAEATYTVVSLEDGTFGVKVAIPETYPATVSPFASKAEAEAWIARHKTQVEAGPPAAGAGETAPPGQEICASSRARTECAAATWSRARTV
jgi:hypothetical protein